MSGLVAGMASISLSMRHTMGAIGFSTGKKAFIGRVIARKGNVEAPSDCRVRWY